LLAWNIDGILSKLDDPDFVRCLHDFSFLCLCETFVEYLDMSDRFHDFVSHVLPAKKLSSRGRRSGGIICLVHKDIEKYFVRLDCMHDCIVFKVDKALFGMNRDILLFNVYVPPVGSPYYETINEPNGIVNLENCISDMLHVHGDAAIILCGDFNARTGNKSIIDVNLNEMLSDVTDELRCSDDSTVNEFGQSLLSLCLALELTILNGFIDKDNSERYTYVSPNGSSVIDYIIVSADIVPYCQSLRVKESVLSPHMSLELVLNCTNVCHRRDKICSRATQTKIVWDSRSSEIFVGNLREGLTEANISELMEDGDFNVNTATRRITEAIEGAAEFLKKTFKMTVKSKRRWFDGECFLSKKVARCKLRRYLFTRSEQDRISYTNSRREYKKLIRCKKDEYRRSVTAVLTTHVRDAQIFWKQIKALSSNYRAPTGIPPDAWVEHFSNIFLAPREHRHTSMNTVSRTFVCNSNLLDADITNSEIKEAISHLKAGKAPGTDNVLGDMIKSASGVLLPCLLRLFNRIFQMSVYPKQWVESIIVPIHKKGAFNDPNNYRGISLTSNLSKVFLHILNNRLQSWAEENGVIGEEQAGFRRKYSTVDNIFVLHSVVKKYLFRHKKLFVAFVDFSKAFDTVNRQALWGILEQFGIQGRMGNMLKAVYECVKCCVKCDGITTDFFSCQNGLKQGCKLSPFLFSLLMTSLANEIKDKGKHGVQLVANGIDLFVLLFADDVVLLSDTVPGLQNQINNLEAAAGRLGLRANLQKTKVMSFRLGGHMARHEVWYLYDQKLEVVSAYRYLGVTLSTKVCTNAVLSDLACRGRAAVYRIMRTLRGLVHVSPQVLNKIVDAQIQPILLYGSEIWGMDDCQVVETVHLSMLKQALNVSPRTANTMVYGETGRYPLYINAVIKSVKYWLKIIKMEEHRFPYLVYKTMLISIDECDNWASKVKQILFNNNLSNIWSAQEVGNEREFLKTLRERLVETFTGRWLHDLQKSPRYKLYRGFKSTFGIERYLFVLDRKVFRDSMVRFRLGISELFVHRMRYCSNTFETLCPNCREEDEDERHFLLNCPALHDLQIKYLIPYVEEISTDPFVYLLSSNETRVIRAVATYLYHAFKRRDEALLSPTQNAFFLD